MTDIVERLRALTAVDGCQASREAADLIEALRKEIQELLDELAYHGVYPK